MYISLSLSISLNLHICVTHSITLPHTRWPLDEYNNSIYIHMHNTHSINESRGFRFVAPFAFCSSHYSTGTSRVTNCRRNRFHRAPSRIACQRRMAAALFVQLVRLRRPSRHKSYKSDGPLVRGTDVAIRSNNSETTLSYILL